MVSSPFHVAFEFFPETKLLDPAHDAKAFPKFGLVLDLESDSIILTWLELFLRHHHFRGIFILYLWFLWSILLSIISIFVIHLILNHFKVIVSHHIWTNLCQRNIVCFAWRVRTQCVLHLAGNLLFLFLINIHDLLKSVILAKTHSPAWLIGLGFDWWLVALSFETLLLLVGQGVLRRQIHLRGHFRVCDRLNHWLFVVYVVVWRFGFLSFFNGLLFWLVSSVVAFGDATKAVVFVSASSKRFFVLVTHISIEKSVGVYVFIWWFFIHLYNLIS